MTFGLTDMKIKLLTFQATDIDQHHKISLRTIRNYTHRAAWATQLLEPLRPFLQPLFTFIQATKDFEDSQLVLTPPLVKLVNAFLLKHWRHPAPESAEFRRPLPLAAAGDAGAKKLATGHSYTVGGWVGSPGITRKEDAWWWFAEDLMNYQDHPVAKEILACAGGLDGAPSAKVSPLELLTDYIILNNLITKIIGAGTSWTAPARTDNLGNQYIVTKHYTGRWPGAAILMAMASILLATGAYVELAHHPRERNAWADDLANLDTSGFNPQRRHRPFAANMRNEHSDFLAELLAKGRQLGLHDGKRARLPPPKPDSSAN